MIGRIEDVIFLGVQLVYTILHDIKFNNNLFQTAISFTIFLSQIVICEFQKKTQLPAEYTYLDP